MNLSEQSLAAINSRIQTANLKLYDKLVEDILLKQEFIIFLVFVVIILIILNAFWLIVTNVYFKKYVANLSRNRYYTHILKPPQTTNSLDIIEQGENLMATSSQPGGSSNSNKFCVRVEEKCEQSFKCRVSKGKRLISEVEMSLMKRSKSLEPSKNAELKRGEREEDTHSSKSSPLLYLKTDRDNGDRVNFERDEYVSYNRERERKKMGLDFMKMLHESRQRVNSRPRRMGTSTAHELVVDTSTPADSNSLKSIEREDD